MSTKKRDKKKERKQRKLMMEKYGHLIGCKTEDIPEKHRATNGGLKCFKKVFQRDDHKNVNKSLPKKRCGNVCATGSLFCKRHGGGNTHGLVHGNRSEIIFKNSFSNSMSDIFSAFLNDPNILDHKHELATLRTLMVSYIDKFKDNQPRNNPRKIMRLVKKIVNSEFLSEYEQYVQIKELIENEMSILDGTVIDRITRLVENIGKGVERIDKIERKSDFMLTPEGFKIILSQFSTILNESVKDDKILRTIYEGLMQVHTSTVGSVNPQVSKAISRK